MRIRVKTTALVGALFVSGVSAVTFAQALEFSALDYGSRLGVALGSSNIAEATKLLDDLKSCGVEALVSANGLVSLSDLEVALSGNATFDVALLSVANAFLIDGKSVPYVRCDVSAGNMDGSISTGTLPVGSTG